MSIICLQGCQNLNKPAAFFKDAPVPISSPSQEQPNRSELRPVITTFISHVDIPWAMDFAPDGRIFFTERKGQIRVIKDNQLMPEPWLTIESVQNGEGGLMGLAIDPNFSDNGLIYVAITQKKSNGERVNRILVLKENPDKQTGSMIRSLIADIPARTNHNGGQIKFGPDKKLYWTMGELFKAELAQDLSSLNGKILRLNADGSIPTDNPFPDSYVYSYGHRNPQGLAWHPDSKQLFSTEHGPSGEAGCCKDELNLIEKGKNYGWPQISGSQSKEGLVSPLLHSGDSTTWAPGGATFVSQGPWKNSLLFAGLRGATLYRVIFKEPPSMVERVETHYVGQFGRLRNIVEGPDGALYLLTSNRDGRGTASEDDDRILKIEFKAK